MGSGRLPQNNRKYNIRHLWGTNREMLRLTAMGMKRKDVAEAVGVTPVTVTNTVNSQLGRAVLGKLHEERDKEAAIINDRLRELATEAVEVMADIMQDKDSPTAVRAKVAIEVLEKAGYGSPKTRINVFEGHLTVNDVEVIRARAAKAGVLIGSAAVPQLGNTVREVLDVQPIETMQDESHPICVGDNYH